MKPRSHPQEDLIMEYVKEYGKIVPAQMCGRIWRGVMFGSETPRYCRFLRARGKLASRRDGKMTIFFPISEPYQDSLL